MLPFFSSYTHTPVHCRSFLKALAQERQNKRVYSPAECSQGNQQIDPATAWTQMWQVFNTRFLEVSRSVGLHLSVSKAFRMHVVRRCSPPQHVRGSQVRSHIVGSSTVGAEKSAFGTSTMTDLFSTKLLSCLTPCAVSCKGSQDRNRAEAPDVATNVSADELQEGTASAVT
jgi:hypothetical protein